MTDFIEVVDKENQTLVLIPVEQIKSISDNDGLSALIEVDRIKDESIGFITEETYLQIKNKLKNLGKII